MYEISIIKNLIAQHYLENEEGFESKRHSHHYKIEVILSGDKLNTNGYLVNFIEVEEIIDDAIEYFRDKTLNEIAEFTDINPSLENFSKIFCKRFITKLNSANINSVRIKIWESDNAWALYQEEIKH